MSKYIDHRCKVNKKNDDDKLPASVVEFGDYLLTIKETSQKTVNAYKNDLALFFRYLVHKKKSTVNIDTTNISNVDEKFIRSIKLQDLYGFLSYCQKERENKAYARARKVATLKSYFKYLQTKAKIIKENITLELEKPKLPNRNPIYLTLEESKQVLTSLDKNSRDYDRNYCIFVILLNTGIRLSELTGIKLNDIKEGILTVIGKGNKERDIPLNNACIKAIENHLSSRDNDKLTDDEKKYLINLGEQAIEKMVKKSTIKAGITNGDIYTPHKMRHTTATLMYKHGNTDIVELQKLLGHKNLSTTQIYTHCDEESLKQAVSKNPLADF